MPSKKKKYNARFPAGRIKKIMQTDEEVGKVAQAVPVIISKALEMFIESLLKKSTQITLSRNAKTLTPSHMKQCILSENRFDFLKDLVKNIPDASIQEDNENNALVESMSSLDKMEDSNSIEVSSPPNLKENITSPQANFYIEQSTSTTSTTSRMPVIQFGPKVRETSRINFSVNSILSETKPEPHYNKKDEPDLVMLPTPSLVPIGSPTVSNLQKLSPCESVPVPKPYYGHSTGDNLCIDEDYDN